MVQAPIVADFMDKTLTTLKPDMSLNTAIDILMKKRLIAAIVINNDDEILGLLSEKDCLKVLLQQAYDQLPWGVVKDYMHKAPTGIPSTMPISEVVKIFIEQRSRRLPVIESGKLVGQITRRDILRGLHTHLGT